MTTRTMTISNRFLGVASFMSEGISSHDCMGVPWTETIRSPGLSPEPSAGEPLSTEPMTGGKVGRPVQPMIM